MIFLIIFILIIVMILALQLKILWAAALCLVAMLVIGLYYYILGEAEKKFNEDIKKLAKKLYGGNNDGK